ncbi:hypothetical protein OHC33_011014 [Knufia fluminis]|uniref:FHA domain-containing protein n=1 Tax=Knufia fluminis TaxID=191047 RepID=A0AAN8E8G2_9EURO|nr:hypothetical protein OHC33_011014 [Knufia fluminis]
MSNYERQYNSRDVSPGPRSKRRRGDDDSRNQSPPRASRRDRHSDNNRNEERPRKKRSMSPASDQEDGARRKDHRKYRDRSPRASHHKHRRRSHSRSRSRSRSRSPRDLERSRAPLPPQQQAFDKERNPDAPVIDKQKPNFAPSGKLAAASNTVQTAGQTIVLKYHEPAEARKPPARDAWRMYVFKNDEIVDTIQLSEQSCWLFGREMAVCDIPVEHPSCSKQHAVVQFRYIEKRNEFGDKIGKVKPYVLDLESSNGTYVNEESIPEAKYVELRDKDVVKFGHSRREYVIQLPSG